MSIQWILHNRYMTPGSFRGNRSYGNEKLKGNACGERDEAWGYWSTTSDVSRNLFNYFSGDVYMGGYPYHGMTGVTEVSNVNKQAINRTVHFMNKVYNLVGDKVYVYDEVAHTWSTSLSMTGKIGTESNSIGLYPVFVNNAPHLVTAWNVGASSTWQSAYFNGDTETWTLGATASIIDVSDSNGGVLNEIQHNGRIYFITDSTASIWYFDFAINGFGSVGWSNTVRHPMDFVVFHNNLYCITKNNSWSHQVHKIAGSATSLVFTLPKGTILDPEGWSEHSAMSTTNNFEGRNLIMVDNVHTASGNKPVMWAFFMWFDAPLAAGDDDHDHGVGYIPFVLDDNGDLDEDLGIGFSANAAFMSNPFKMGVDQQGAVGPYFKHTSKPEETVLRAFIDQRDRELSESSVSTIHCFSRYGAGCGGEPVGHMYAGGGGEWNLMASWTWHGGGAPGYPLPNWGGSYSWDYDGGLREARHRGFPHEKIGGGGRISQLLPDGNQNIDIVFAGTDTTPENGIIRIKYKLITTPGIPNGTNVSVKWYYDENLHAPETPCTLTETSDGSISGVRVVSLPAESGVTYWVDWAARSDGLPRHSSYYLNGVVQTADTLTTPLDDPTDLYGLGLWLEADDETTITSGVNGRISEWANKVYSSSGVFTSGLPSILQSVSASQPLYVQNANNGLGGVNFQIASGSFMFSSGSPVVAEPYTVFVIYEPESVGAAQTIFSIAGDEAFYTWDNGYAPSGTIVTDGEYFNIETSSVDNSIVLSSQDLYRTNEGVSERALALDSGAFPFKAKMAVWREESFRSKGDYTPSGVPQEVTINTDGEVDASGTWTSSNTSLGRFTGGQNAGAYSSAGKYFDGNIYEVAVYYGVLQDLEVDRFKLYASGKYDLT